DAIVIVENITVHLSMGQSPSEASRSAIVELTPALIGSTLTPIVVFVPLIFLGGITAVFFRALALTLVTALLASLVLAIFFTPVLARFVVRGRAIPTEARWLMWLTGRYERALHGCLRHVRWVLAGAGLV